MKRIYHTHDKWEDLGMWLRKPFNLQDIIDFMADTELYGEYMWKVICEWPLTCEHNLTAPGNKQAWLGHASAYMAIGSPEAITRQAWGYLAPQQQDAANEKAQSCIDIWEWQHHNNGISAITGPYIDSYLQKGYEEIPDELPGELIELAPAYKFICRAILRNDLHLTSLGYNKPRSETYNLLKRIELNERTRSN